MAMQAIIGRAQIAQASVAGGRLLPVLRTRNYEWFLRAARVGGAMIALAVACAPVLAATPSKPLWTTALVMVIVLGLLGAAAVAIGSAMAFLTRPVRESHAIALNESARTVVRHIESGMFVEYGDGHRSKQAFRAHYKKLAGCLDAWDDLRLAGAEAQRVLGEHIEAAMLEHDLAVDTYCWPRLMPFMRELAMDHARGEAPEPPHLEWQGFSSAETPGSPAIPGPPYGSINPVGDQEWISLPPREHETADQWRERARTHIERLERFVAVTHASAKTHGQVAVEAQQGVMTFKREQLPAILDALELLQDREAPRQRHRCGSC